MTKEKAKKEAKEQDEQFSPFCPLINGECETDCVCYVNAQPVEHSIKSSGWYVSGGYCANNMFHNCD